MTVFRFLVLVVALPVVTAAPIEAVAHSLGGVVPGGFMAGFVHVIGDPDHVLTALFLAVSGFLLHRIFRYGRKARGRASDRSLPRI
ncbi:MAG: hypothetical protein FJX42_05375 [Alphaproteobacteria bacterium]|nr:hypothetical protein [Alphaproteobacteria bacterium]